MLPLKSDVELAPFSEILLLGHGGLACFLDVKAFLRAAGQKGLPKLEPRRPEPAVVEDAAALHSKRCPECGAELEHEGGCASCRSCGYSKCN